MGPTIVRQYQLFLIQEKKLAWSSYNQIVCALRFFYAKTLKRAFLLQEIPFPRMEQRLPTILSREEVAKILTVPRHLKTRALLMTIYATGLRVRCSIGLGFQIGNKYELRFRAELHIVSRAWRDEARSRRSPTPG